MRWREAGACTGLPAPATGPSSVSRGSGAAYEGLLRHGCSATRDENRHGGKLKHFVSDAAEHEARDVREAARAHDDQVALTLCRGLDDVPRCMAGEGMLDLAVHVSDPVLLDGFDRVGDHPLGLVYGLEREGAGSPGLTLMNVEDEDIGFELTRDLGRVRNRARGERRPVYGNQDSLEHIDHLFWLIS